MDPHLHNDFYLEEKVENLRRAHEHEMGEMIQLIKEMDPKIYWDSINSVLIYLRHNHSILYWKMIDQWRDLH